MKNKVILDEMQQKTLLEIEHKTLHIALTGLLIVILMQQIFWKDGQNTLGESAVLLISSGYLFCCPTSKTESGTAPNPSAQKATGPSACWSVWQWVSSWE